ncbi:uncharacterized protein F4812DRAFT_38118 [Daldinia caldariorum]|uniref:uncharacterized protein n=1 Tax=Daldinia caldariorum TaxID=326644 RepID=UPI00200775D4|nr:uncharacterized protein F4812DRAFT_38118 [Daldinia caldariorum]KAI1473073.1 hypothetical protein F4812DRAFT_38118 [Daldinia caldariorum]
MDRFEYNSSPSRVAFSSGTTKKIPEELSRANVSKPFLLSPPQHVSHIDLLKGVLGDAVSGVFAEATMHTPVEALYARNINPIINLFAQEGVKALAEVDSEKGAKGRVYAGE